MATRTAQAIVAWAARDGDNGKGLNDESPDSDSGDYQLGTDGRGVKRFARTPIINLVALRTKLHASKSVSGTINKILISNTVGFPAPTDYNKGVRALLLKFCESLGPGPVLKMLFWVSVATDDEYDCSRIESRLDWIGLAVRLPDTPRRQAEHCASSGLEKEKAFQRNASARCRCGADSASSTLSYHDDRTRSKHIRWCLTLA